MRLSRLIPSALLTFAPPLAMTQPAAPTAEAIRHVLRFPDATSHYVSVETSVPTGGRPEVELFMAVWTPGSYLVREYARNVEDVRAKDEKGAARAVDKTRKNRWRVESGGRRRSPFPTASTPARWAYAATTSSGTSPS